MDRKQFIKFVGSASVMLTAPVLLSSCGNEDSDIKKKREETGVNCSENVSEISKKKKEEFDYTESSPHEDKTCGVCTHWVPQPDKPCGMCDVVVGPVNPNGYCDQWMAKPGETA